MKKTRFVAMVLAVAVMLIGAGYAAWTETLTITNTVSTGYVDVDLLNGSVVVHSTEVANSDDALDRTASATGSEQSATVTITNLYPGAEAVVTIPVKNNSTIPVKYESIDTVGEPAWLTISEEYPQNLAVGVEDAIVLTLVVGDNAPESPDGQNIQFTTTAIYEQFNVN